MKLFVIEPISSPSVTRIPSKPISSFSKSVEIILECEDGVPVESRPGIAKCPTITIFAPALIASLKGYNSIFSSSSFVPGITGSDVWLSVEVLP